MQAAALGILALPRHTATVYLNHTPDPGHWLCNPSGVLVLAEQRPLATVAGSGLCLNLLADRVAVGQSSLGLAATNYGDK